MSEKTTIMVLDYAKILFFYQDAVKNGLELENITKEDVESLRKFHEKEVTINMQTHQWMLVEDNKIQVPRKFISEKEVNAYEPVGYYN